MSNTFEKIGNWIGITTKPRTEKQLAEEHEKARKEAIKKWGEGITECTENVQTWTQNIFDAREYLRKAHYQKALLEVSGLREGKVDMAHIDKIIDSQIIDLAKLTEAVKIRQNKTEYSFENSKPQTKVAPKASPQKIETVSLG